MVGVATEEVASAARTPPRGLAPHPPESPERPPGARPFRRARLADLRLLQAEEALSRAKGELHCEQARHAASADQRHRLHERERERKNRREAHQHWQRRRHEAATALQALVRGFLVRRVVLPEALAERCRKELAAGRIHLKDALRDLRHTCHNLAFLDGNREEAAVKIQAWWRGVLDVRIFRLLGIHRKLLSTVHRVEDCATHIQCRYRGHLVRRVIDDLRVEKIKRDLLVEKRQSERTNRLATKIQAVARSMMASREVMNRRRHTRTIAEGLPWEPIDPDAIFDGRSGRMSAGAAPGRMSTGVTHSISERPYAKQSPAQAAATRRRRMSDFLMSSRLDDAVEQSPRHLAPLTVPARLVKASPSGSRKRMSMAGAISVGSVGGRASPRISSASPSPKAGRGPPGFF